MDKLRKFAIALFLVFVSTSAQADMGVPMLFVTLPKLVIGLVPVVILETFVLSFRLGKSFASQLGPAAVANLVSTLIGVPITWVLLVTLQVVSGGQSAYGLQTLRQKFLAITWQAPWLIPYESDLNWMIPAASLVLLVPFFVASRLIEVPIVVRMGRSDEPRRVRVAVLWANAASYAFLALCALLWLAWGLTHPTHIS
jgi:hypothetical protein